MATEPEPHVPSLEEIRLLYAAAGVTLSELDGHGDSIRFIAMVNGTYLEILPYRTDGVADRQYLLERLQAFVNEEKYSVAANRYAQALAHTMQQTKEQLLRNLLQDPK